MALHGNKSGVVHHSTPVKVAKGREYKPAWKAKLENEPEAASEPAYDKPADSDNDDKPSLKGFFGKRRKK